MALMLKIKGRLKKKKKKKKDNRRKNGELDILGDVKKPKKQWPWWWKETAKKTQEKGRQSYLW